MTIGEFVLYLSPSSDVLICTKLYGFSRYRGLVKNIPDELRKARIYRAYPGCYLTVISLESYIGD